jgi:hypothetical protein
MEMMKGMMSPSASAAAATSASGADRRLPTPKVRIAAPISAPSTPLAMGASGMGCRGGAGSKPFYAALMAMPSLTPTFDAERNSAAESVDTPAEIQQLAEGCSTHA